MICLKAQISDKGALGEALKEAARQGDLGAVDQAIATAIKNTTKGMVKDGGAQESDTIQANLQTLGDSIKVQISNQKIQAQLDRAQAESQKRLIDAQEKAALAQLNLQQRIAFMGGLQGRFRKS